jgi:hypothetical protein
MSTGKIKNEPAFPSSYTDMTNVPVRGMTLRDYFAAQAMQGYITGGYDVYPYEIPIKAYKMADMMLEERKN